MYILKAVIETLGYRTSTIKNERIEFKTKEELDDFIRVLKNPNSRFHIKGYEVIETRK